MLLRSLARIALAIAPALACLPATAQNLLTFGDFEVPPGETFPEVPSWELLEFRTGMPTVAINSAALVGFADNPIDPLNENPDDLGLWFRAFVGNQDDGPADAILQQVVAATPGETYTFTGEAAFETNYAGGLFGFDTETQFELAFLDAGGAEIGTPVVRDLSTEVFNGFGYSGINGNPAVTPLTGTAPGNAASVRVRAQGLSMETSMANPQSAFVDNFSLTSSSNPSTELLLNPNLNEPPMLPPTPEEVLSEFWTFGETPEEVDSLQTAGFANNGATGGSNGIWVRPFVADADSSAISQLAPGAPGETYTFTASARWEVNYVGDASATDENETLIELSFLDEGGEVIDSAVLDLRDDGKTADNEWSTHMVSAVAPEGTIEVRVAGIVNNLTNNDEDPAAQSAFWDDFVLEVGGDDPLFGDFEPDGDVDIIDFGLFADAFNSVTGDPNYDVLADAEPDGDVDIIDFGLFADNFGIGTASAVPEPMTAGMLLVALLVAPRRRG